MTGPNDSMGFMASRKPGSIHVFRSASTPSPGHTWNGKRLQLERDRTRAVRSARRPRNRCIPSSSPVNNTNRIERRGEYRCPKYRERLRSPPQHRSCCQPFQGCAPRCQDARRRAPIHPASPGRICRDDVLLFRGSPLRFVYFSVWTSTPASEMRRRPRLMARAAAGVPALDRQVHRSGGGGFQQEVTHLRIGNNFRRDLLAERLTVAEHACALPCARIANPERIGPRGGQLGSKGIGLIRNSTIGEPAESLANLIQFLASQPCYITLNFERIGNSMPAEIE